MYPRQIKDNVLLPRVHDEVFISNKADASVNYKTKLNINMVLKA